MRQEAVVALLCLLVKASGWGARGTGSTLRGLFGGGGGGLGSFGKSAETWRANVGSKVPWGMFNGTARATVGRQQQQQQQTKGFSIEKWWEGQTKGSRGILIWLLPAVLSQLVILKSVVPLFTDRISQYLQPLAVFLFVALTPGKGLRLFQNIMLTSSAIGTCFMFRDTYCAGSSWLPLEPREDSYAVVTGATSGLGRAFAQLLYSQGFNLILVAARSKQLREMRNGLLGAGAGEGGEVEEVQYADAQAQIRVISDAPSSSSSSSSSSSIKTNDATGGKARREIVVISVDLSDVDGPDAVLRELKRRRIDDKVDVLINNAEAGARGALIEAPVASLGRLIDLNVRATVGLTRLLAPRMIKRDTGARILIVGSLAAAGPGPDVAVYTASKAFISSFASSMRRELLPQGVLVTLALAGPTVSQDGGIPSSFARSSGTADAFVFKLPGLYVFLYKARPLLLFWALDTHPSLSLQYSPQNAVHGRGSPNDALGHAARTGPGRAGAASAPLCALCVARPARCSCRGPGACCMAATGQVDSSHRRAAQSQAALLSRQRFCKCPRATQLGRRETGWRRRRPPPLSLRAPRGPPS